MNIAIDAMGGDYAPQKIIEGAVDYAKENNHALILVGRQDKISSELKKYSIQGLAISIHHAAEVIEMHESPSRASKVKQDASIVVATKLLAQGKVDALVSAGNSGAVMTSALRYLGRLPGIHRPAIATLLPTQRGHCVVADAGANADCKPEFLLQFSIMAKLVAEKILDIQNPKVGLLSIGEEKEKGNHLTKETFPLLASAPQIQFIGNVEGRDVPKGRADVVVCDGFVGNVVLKTMEGTADAIGKMIKFEISSSVLAKIGYFFIRPAFKRFRKRVDYAEYGGAPLLGVKGVCIIAHGKSNAKAIKNAIRVAEQFASKKVNEGIVSAIQNLPKKETQEQVQTTSCQS
ncbi:MAG: phosphate acyltransferase PlsX [Elusimicrobia bacterium]|nr:phosphate acyltransferase PlsX [Elusimicrobiota bacterium]MBI2915224.1 phosphate acyltransferase PlsX [Elusimicrobiota bacterium]MBI4218348.1 phosphate acyltransferase PlsX [Elusimicrobiota bacterium]